MTKFGQFITVDREIYKICPKCRGEITPDMTSAYSKEWCPFCGLNHSEVFKVVENTDDENSIIIIR